MPSQRYRSNGKVRNMCIVGKHQIYQILVTLHPVEVGVVIKTTPTGFNPKIPGISSRIAVSDAPVSIIARTSIYCCGCPAGGVMVAAVSLIPRISPLL